MTASSNTNYRTTILEEGPVARRQAAMRTTSAKRAVTTEIPVLFRIPDANQVIKNEARTASQVPASEAFASMADMATSTKSSAAKSPAPEVETPRAEVRSESKHEALRAAAKPSDVVNSSALAAKVEAAAEPTKDTSAAKTTVASEPTPFRKRFNSAEVSAAPAAATKTEVTTPSVTDTTPPAEANAPSPLERAQMRQRRQQEEATAPKETGPGWFQSQGKFIAICFVIALIATVTLARYKRNQAKPMADQMAHEETHEGHDHADHGAPELPPAKEEATTVARQPSAAPSLIPETTSPAGPDFSSSPAEATATSAPAADSESLFPWKPAEDRTATRPDAPSTAPAYGPEGVAPTEESPAASQYPETNPENHRTIDPANPNSLRPSTGSQPRSSGGSLRSEAVG